MQDPFNISALGTLQSEFNSSVAVADPQGFLQLFLLFLIRVLTTPTAVGLVGFLDAPTVI